MADDPHLRMVTVILRKPGYGLAAPWLTERRLLNSQCVVSVREVTLTAYAKAACEVVLLTGDTWFVDGGLERLAFDLGVS